MSYASSGVALCGVLTTYMLLQGNNLDVITGRWIDDSAGIGAGIDSFYEYLFKAFVLFGNAEFLRMFEQVRYK